MCLFTKSAARPIFNKYSDRSMEVKVPGLLGNYERPTDQPTKQQTDRLTDRPDHFTSNNLYILKASCAADQKFLIIGFFIE